MIEWDFIDHPGWFEVHSHGDRSDPGRITALWDAIVTHAREQAVHHVLMVQRIEGRLSPQLVYAEHGPLQDWLRHLDWPLVVAVVDTNPDSYHDNMILAGQAREQGIEVRLFEREEAARDWLLGRLEGGGP